MSDLHKQVSACCISLFHVSACSLSHSLSLSYALSQRTIQIWIWPILWFSDSIAAFSQQLQREKTSRGASLYQNREVVRIAAVLVQ